MLYETPISGVSMFDSGSSEHLGEAISYGGVILASRHLLSLGQSVHINLVYTCRMACIVCPDSQLFVSIGRKLYAVSVLRRGISCDNMRIVIFHHRNSAPKSCLLSGNARGSRLYEQIIVDGDIAWVTQ